MKFILIFNVYISVLFSQQFTESVELAEDLSFHSNGTKLLNPLSGGYQKMYAQILDWENNGKKELFLLNSGYSFPMVFEQKDVGKFEFETKYIKFDGLNLQRWFYFLDYDSDGDFDVLTLDRFDAIGVQINTGSNTSMTFEAFKRLREPNNHLIQTELGNLPVLYDINKDGKLDLFLTTQGEGTIKFFKNVGDKTASFSLVTEKYANIAIIARAKQREKKHGQSSFTFVDFDKDGDEDILWGDQFQRYFYYLENTGTQSEPIYNTEDDHFPPGDQLNVSINYNFPVVTDLDNDSFQDILLLPQIDNFITFQLYRGTENYNRFHYVEENHLSTIDAGYSSAVAFFDYNNDGFKDLILSTYLNQDYVFDLQTFTNVSSLNKQFVQQDLFLTTHPWKRDFLGVEDFQFYDLNADGIWDLVFLDQNGNIRTSNNSGSPENPIFRFVKTVKDVGSSTSSFKLHDLDNDRKPELIAVSRLGNVSAYTSIENSFSDQIDFSVFKDKFNSFMIFDVVESRTFVFFNPHSYKLHVINLDSLHQLKDSVSYTLDFPKISGLRSMEVEDINNDGFYDYIFGHTNGGVLIGYGKEKNIKPLPDKRSEPFPNPTYATQRLAFPSGEKIHKFKCYNVLGQEIPIHLISFRGDIIEWQFPKNVSNGIYFVKLNNQTYKIIKLMESR